MYLIEKKVLLVDNKPTDFYEAIRISHKQGYDHSWITDKERNLICFGRTVKIDSYELCEFQDDYAELAKNIAEQSKDTYNVFLDIKKYYKQLKREQHRRER